MDGKPKLCELLGVDVEERFDVLVEGLSIMLGAYIDKNGFMKTICGNAMTGLNICKIINGDFTIVSKNYLTPQEMAICKLAGAKYISRDSEGDTVYLWKSVPDSEKDTLNRKDLIASFNRPYFKGIKWSGTKVEDVDVTKE